MSHTLVLQLNDEIYSRIRRRAEEVGDTPVELALKALEKSFTGLRGDTAPRPPEEEPFTRLLGTVSYTDEEDLLAPVEESWSADV